GVGKEGGGGEGNEGGEEQTEERGEAAIGWRDRGDHGCGPPPIGDRDGRPPRRGHHRAAGRSDVPTPPSQNAASDKRDGPEGRATPACPPEREAVVCAAAPPPGPGCGRHGPRTTDRPRAAARPRRLDRSRRVGAGGRVPHRVAEERAGRALLQPLTERHRLTDYCSRRTGTMKDFRGKVAVVTGGGTG